ncbi:MAG: protein kinase [Candidatus Aminicenantes bacterium]|nr:protein kinase [Candidatus Aminicenantes bacterium]
MIGQTISHYKIIEKLGEGGMGIVYKAEDTKLKRTVTLKFIRTQAMEVAEEKTRFVREAQAAAALDHPNICTIYEIDEAKGKTFIAMAYIKGQSLNDKIKSAPLKLEEVLDIGIQVAQGLQEAHEKKVFHRDIKSSNIMVTDKGQAKIMDFGIAKLAGGTEITRPAAFMGTVAYMSPEQASAEPLDHRTDIWSLGVVLYEMLTGQVPFKGEHEQVILHSILNKNPQPITSLHSGVPLELEAIVNKCLEKEPSERYQTSADLIADLNRLKRDMTTGKTAMAAATATYPTPTATLARPFPRLMRKMALPIGAVILILVFLLVLPPTRRIVQNWLGFEIIPAEKSLAILPFTIVGGDAEERAFCDGLVENLTSKLTQLEQFQRRLFILPSIDVHEFEITSPSEAERVFRVSLAVMGSFKRIGDMFSLTLKLVDTKTQRELKSQIMTDHIANISALQKDAIFKMVEMLEVKLQPHMRDILTSGGTTIPGAYESYLQGLGYMERNEKEETLETAISLFQRAIEQDPHFALAHGGLGKAFWRKYKLTKNSELLEKARLSCTKAIEISDNLASVHVRLGIIYREAGQYEDAIKEFQQALLDDPVNYDAVQELAEVYENLGRLEKAEETYKQAIKLKPSYWHGYSRLGFFYYIYGRNVKAEKMYNRAIALATENILDYNNLIAIYYLLGQNDQAEAMFEKSIAIKPSSDAYSNMGLIYFMQRRYADALAMYEEAIELGVGEDTHVIWANLADSYRYTPGYSEKAPEAYQRAIKIANKELEINPGDAQLRSSLAVFYAKSGDSQMALAEISKARSLAPNDVPIILDCVLVFEIINQRDQAIQALQEYIERGGSIMEVRDHPDLSGLRADPRYQKLVE